MQAGYIKSLDGVRALAIILVMSFHAGLTDYGWMGVQLFFVLSGYLITGILWKEKFNDTPLSFKFKKFWVRRSLRIFPLYFGYLLVIGIIYLLFHFPVYYPDYATYLFTYTFNYTRLLAVWQGNPLFTHLWSLCIEEQFYLFFPLVVFLLPPKWIKFFLPLMILLAPLTRHFLFEYYHSKASALVAADAVYWNTLSHLDAFFMGGLIPVFTLGKKISNPGSLFILTLVLVLIAGLLNYLNSDGIHSFIRDLGYSHDEVGNYAHVWRYSLLNLFFASFILLLTSKQVHLLAWVRKIFENEILVKIGKVSYGMYIFHWLIYVYIFVRYLKFDSYYLQLLIFLPYLLAVYLVAALSFRFYESYFISLKDKFFLKNKTKVPDSKEMEQTGSKS